jgi:hypothetical protein
MKAEVDSIVYQGLFFNVLLHFWENGNQRGSFSRFYHACRKNRNHEYGDDNGLYYLLPF